MTVWHESVALIRRDAEAELTPLDGRDRRASVPAPAPGTDVPTRATTLIPRLWPVPAGTGSALRLLLLGGGGVLLGLGPPPGFCRLCGSAAAHS